MIGCVIHKRCGLIEILKYAVDSGCNFFQIFTDEMHDSKTRTNLKKFGECLEKYNAKMVIHSSYKINLSNPTDSYKYSSSIKSLTKDLVISNDIGPRCIGVIVHMGKNVRTNNISHRAAMENYIKGIKYCLRETPDSTTIILETGASQGAEIGSSIESMSEILKGLTREERSRVKICIDTCHIWATGYDISTGAAAKKYLREFDNKIGLENVVCIHLNDSKNGLGSKIDRHADLSFGKIGVRGLKFIARWANKNRIPMVMEVPLDSVNPRTNSDTTHAEQLELVMSWI